MKKLLIFALLGVIVTGALPAQKKKTYIEIKISDNNGFQYLSQDYRFTHDSLFITGISDNGNTRVEYLSRALTKAERKQMQLFFTTFKCDSLSKEYFSDFNSLGYISYDHYPRVLDMYLKKDDKEYISKITNCYVYRVGDMINFLNTFLPAEVKILFRKEDFKAAY